MAVPTAKTNPLAGVGKTIGALTPESKRDEFRRYLEKTGVMDSLTRVLVGLYEEVDRPANPVDYFLEHLSTGGSPRAELESLREAMNAVQAQLNESDEDNKRLRLRLEQYETVEPPASKTRKVSNSNANPPARDLEKTNENAGAQQENASPV